MCIRPFAWLGLGRMSVGEFLGQTWKETEQHEIFTRASAISFYAMAALVPFLALLLTLSARLLPDLAAGNRATPGIGDLTIEELEATLRAVFPAAAYELVADQIAYIQSRPPVTLLSIGLAIALWSASSLFVAIIDAMNRIYGLPPTRKLWQLNLSGIVLIVFQRLIGIVLAIVQTVILLAALVLIVAWPQIIRLFHLDAFAAELMTIAKWLIVFLMIQFCYALIFRLGPDCPQQRKWITPGSVFGAVFFVIASLGFRIYVQNHASYDATYGSLAGVMILLLWFWISAVVLLVAAVINKIVYQSKESKPALVVDDLPQSPAPAPTKDLASQADEALVQTDTVRAQGERAS